MRTGIFVMMMLIMATTAFAHAPSYVVQKDAVVTGDWKWDNGWQNGNFPTATYSMAAKSYCATEGYYVETEKLGTPWKYQLDAIVGANAKGRSVIGFDAWTVNDPATTPATGGYTKYGFTQVNLADFSSSSLSVSGQGAVHVGTTFKATSAFEQQVGVKVN